MSPLYYIGDVSAHITRKYLFRMKFAKKILRFLSRFIACVSDPIVQSLLSGDPDLGGQLFSVRSNDEPRVRPKDCGDHRVFCGVLTGFG